MSEEQPNYTWIPQNQKTILPLDRTKTNDQIIVSDKQTMQLHLHQTCQAKYFSRSTRSVFQGRLPITGVSFAWPVSIFIDRRAHPPRKSMGQHSAPPHGIPRPPGAAVTAGTRRFNPRGSLHPHLRPRVRVPARTQSMAGAPLPPHAGHARGTGHVAPCTELTRSTHADPEFSPGFILHARLFKWGKAPNYIRQEGD